MPARPPWIWMALLAVGIVAIVIVLAAVAAEDGADEEATDAEETTTIVTETETETETVAGAETGGGETDDAAEPTSVVVPDVTGERLVPAGERGEQAGLITDSYPVEADAPAGTVVEQNPAAGTEVAPTRRLRLNVSVGPGERETVRVPDVTGPPAERARRIAWERGFTTITADRDAPSAEEVGEVILQEPRAGTRAPAFTQITLYVGR